MTNDEINLLIDEADSLAYPKVPDDVSHFKPADAYEMGYADARDTMIAWFESKLRTDSGDTPE